MPDFGKRFSDEVDPDDHKALSKEVGRPRGQGGSVTKTGFYAEDRAEWEKHVASIAPAKIIEPKCTVCQSPHRDYVDLLVTQGLPITKIAGMIPGKNGEGNLSRQAITNHREKHMQVMQSFVRDIMENAAELEGVAHDEAVTGAVTKMGLLKLAQQRWLEDLNAGNISVETKDLIQVLKLSNELEENASSSAIEHADRQIQMLKHAIMNGLRDHPEARMLIGKELKRMRELDEAGLDPFNELESYQQTPIPDVEIVELPPGDD